MSDTLASPRLWIVAGPNGSGKSTLYDRTDIEGFGKSVWIINPDLLSARIANKEGLNRTDANLEAVVGIQRWLETSIDTYQTIGVETVLSTDKYRKLVSSAKNRGFQFFLLYVMLRDSSINIERVRLRVTKGGHAVPEDKILDRHRRSLAQLPWFLHEADWARIYDNSGSEPRLVGTKSDGSIEIDPDGPRDLLAAFDLMKDD